ncbi:hypothetical protein MIR68_008380 [Amoeboaphelidium protococcarum]|nr:hypothetical protein MIR68_008380 [Amoeboaphelidium protococcarum]
MPDIWVEVGDTGVVDSHGGKWYASSENPENLYFTKLWCPPEGVKTVATLTFVHGIGEHCMRYDHVFSALAQQNGIKTFSFDQRGFGRTALSTPEFGTNNNNSQDQQQQQQSLQSKGPKQSTSSKNNLSQVRSRPVLGDAGTWDQWMADIDRAVRGDGIVNFREDGVPHFLMGHSMGGMLAVAYVLEHAESSQKHLAGVISSAPGFRPAFSIPYLKRKLGVLASNILPTLNIPTGIDSTGISSDSAVVEKYNTDPYVHKYGSLQTLSSVLAKGEDCITVPDYIAKWPQKLPLLVSYGTADKITSFDGGKLFVDSVTCDDKTFEVFDGAYHEIHNEPNGVKEKAIQTYGDWIAKRAMSTQKL